MNEIEKGNFLTTLFCNLVSPVKQWGSWEFGLPWWLRGKGSARQCRRRGFDPWFRKIPWRRKWQTHPSILTWKIPWMEKPGRLLSMGSQRVRHDWATSLHFTLDTLFGEGNGTPLQYSCLKNPTDGGAWWATVHGVSKSRIWLSDFTSLSYMCI